MPKSSRSIIPGNRSAGAPSVSGILHSIAERRRPDEVEIGCPTYTEGPEDDTASWEDVERIVKGVRWLVKDWVPYGMMTGIIASPKAGKSGFALGALAKPIITGSSWFNGVPGPEPGYVVYCDTERSAAVNIQRAKLWGLPLNRIKVPFPKDPLTPIDLENEEHIQRILEVVCRYKAPLVIVDSFRGAHDGDENNSRIIKPLRGLGRIAEETSTAVALIHHAKKVSVDEDMTVNAGRGSNAFLAAVRVQLVIDQPDPNNGWRRVQVLGENLGNAPLALGFRLTETGLEFGTAPERPRKITEKDTTEAWLRERLKVGEVYNAADIIAEGIQHGHAERTIRKTAVERFGIVPEQVRHGGRISGWRWVLPAPPRERKPSGP